MSRPTKSPCIPGLKQTNSGFTLIELLIVVGIILTIAAIAVPKFLAAVGQAKVAAAVGGIGAMETDIGWYQTTYGVLPNTLSDIGRANFLDPWGTPYEYLNHSTVKGNGKVRKDRFLVPLNSDYDLYSDGEDGQSVSPLTAKSSQDDIIRASNGAYVGLASQF